MQAATAAIICFALCTVMCAKTTALPMLLFQVPWSVLPSPRTTWPFRSGRRCRSNQEVPCRRRRMLLWDPGPRWLQVLAAIRLQSSCSQRKSSAKVQGRLCGLWQRDACALHHLSPCSVADGQSGCLCRWDELLTAPPGSGDVGIGQWEDGISFGRFTERTVNQYAANPGAATALG